MEKTRFLAFLRECIDLDLEVPLELETPLATLEVWDSLAVVSFISAAEIELGIVTSANLVRSCATVADLLALVHKPS